MPDHTTRHALSSKEHTTQWQPPAMNRSVWTTYRHSCR